MNDEQLFRVILIAGFVFVLTIGLYHRIKAHVSGEKLDRRQEGLFILLTLRPIALFKMLGLLAYVINPDLMTWAQLTIPTWVRWTGVFIGISAAMLLIITFRTLGRNITDTVVTRKEHSLVTHGPYRWVRHPFYVAFSLAMVADSLVTANWYLALTGGLCVLLLVLRTQKEEENLLKRFGEEYREYKERTGRFFPHK